MPDYMVCSKEIESGGYGYEPPEVGREVVLVQGAKNPTEAKWAAVKHWRKKRNSPIDEGPHEGHPFKGLLCQQYQIVTDDDKYCEIIKV